VNVLGTLAGRGHQAVVVEAVRDAVGAATNRDYDMIVLVAPNPVEVADACMALRTRFHNPVLVIYSDESRDAAVTALDAGADDVMFAPLSTSEFSARVDVALRYRQALAALASDDVLEFGGLRLDLIGHRAVIAGHTVDFSPTEFQLLAVLARAAGQPVPAETVAAQIWPGDESANMNRLRICVTRLRKLLGRHPGAPVILVQRGVGYAIVLAS
jgi:DNA-binding response OmpR family regulator